MSAPVVITLSEPLMAFNRPVAVIELRPPTLRDLFGLPVKDPFATAAMLGARLSGLPPSVLEGMRNMGDIQELIDATQGFLRTRRDGKASPQNSNPGADGSADSPT